MLSDELIELAKEVGMCGMLTDVVTTIDELERFAALVAAKEREACALVCEAYANSQEAMYPGDPSCHVTARECGAVIRARKP